MMNFETSNNQTGRSRKPYSRVGNYLKTYIMEKVTQQQTDKKSYEWTLTTFEKQGNLWLEWSTNAPFRAQQDRIVVFADGFPADAGGSSKAWTWANSNSPSGGWDSGLTYGADWYCARIAEAAPNGPYQYVEKITTKG